jgi:glycosyltransferase involved in cell wall biosynthesis
MKRIAFICANDTAPWGGSELLWSQAADRLVRAGVKVSIGVKAWEKEAKQITQLRELGCRVILRRDESFSKRLARKVFPTRSSDLEFIGDVTRDKPNLAVISQGNSNDGLRWMQACRTLGVRYVTITQAAAEQFWADDDAAVHLAEHFELAAANYFVCHANMKLVRRQFATALPRGKVVWNPTGVSFDANPQWSGDPLQHLSLACVGRLDLVAKGQDLLIDVLAQPKWKDRAVSLTLYGSGSNRRCIEEQIKHAGLSNVTFGGHVDNIEQVWAKHHAMVLASRFEGLPIAIMEAMLCGRACLATDVAGNGEVIRDGMNGFLAQAPTVSLVGEAMERLWARRGELHAMGQTAASDIRKLMPRDPIAAFIQELEIACG